MQNKIELAKPRDFGELIGDTFTFVKQNLKPLLKYFFIFCGLFVVATAVVTILVEYRTISFYSTPLDPNRFEDTGFNRVMTLFGSTLLLLVFGVIQYVTFNVMILSYMTIYKQKRGEVPTTEEMWGYVKFFFFKILGSTVLLYILIIIGTLFCLIPGIYLSPIFALIPPIMVLENTSFGYAFNKSFKLISNNWWVTFGALVVLYIILFVLNLVVSLPASLLGLGSPFLGIGRDSGNPLALPAIILTNVLRSFAYFIHIVLVVGAGLCYYSLVETKDGTSLIERMDDFGKAEHDPGPQAEEY